MGFSLFLSLYFVVELLLTCPSLYVTVNEGNLSEPFEFKHIISKIFIEINVSWVTIYRRMSDGDWAYGPLMKAFASAVLWRGTVRLLARLLAQQTRSFTHLCVKRLTVFFPVSAGVVSKKQNKQRKHRWPLAMKLKWGSKTHLQLPIIATGAAKDNEMKIFKIRTLH